jgi:hypothetical protein
MTSQISSKGTSTRPTEETFDFGKDFIWSLMDFFDVDKDSNIRLVYNGTSCGLNKALWAPNFWLPTPATATQTLGYGYYMVDINLGELVLNFPLHSILQKFWEATSLTTRQS